MIPDLSVPEEHRDIPEYFKTALWHDQTCLTLLYRNMEWIREKTKIIEYHKLNWMHPFEGNFVYHGFAFGHILTRRIDEVHAEIFKLNTERPPSTTDRD
jgi:hypothetical protein